MRTFEHFNASFDAVCPVYVVRIVTVWLGESGVLEAGFQIAPVLDGAPLGRLRRYSDEDLVSKC